MSIRSEIRYAIGITPIEAIADENSQTHGIVASEVNRNLGGAGTSPVDGYSSSAVVQGYSNAAPYYRQAPDGAAVDISSNTACSFLYIKNTGKEYVSSTELGDDFNYSLKVMSLTTVISILAPGEVLILKDTNGTINCTGIHVQTVTNAGAASSAGDLAVEFLSATGI